MDTAGDHGGGDAAKTYGFADHRSIFVKIVRPETICDNHYAGSFGTVVLRFDETAENGVQAHDFKVVAANDASLNFARLTEADHCEPDCGEIAERAQRLDAGAQIIEFGHGEGCVVVAESRGALTDIDQPVLVAVHERFEEHAAHQREDSGVGADAKR